MNRTLRTLPVGVLLVLLTACTSGAPTGATLPPLTTAAVTTGSTAPSAGAAGPTTDPTTEAPTSESESSVVAETPVDVTVPPEASALPLPTEQIDIPADNPQEEADRAAIEAVWRQVWDLYRDGYNLSPDAVRQRADELLADPVKQSFIDGFLSDQSRKLTGFGSITLHPYWYVAVGGSDSAVLGDCTDYSAFGVKDRTTGEIVNQGQPDANTTGHFVRSPNGVWKLWKISNIEGVPCVAAIGS